MIGRTHLVSLIASLALAVSAGAASAATINANSSTPKDLGLFAPGQYQLIGSGVVDLVGDGSFRMNPDGTPVTTVTTPGYGYFNPNGSDQADGFYGPGGPGLLIGALIGTLSAAPVPGDWFLIGYSAIVNLPAGGHIYALVNDTYYPNDTGSFDVQVSAVPIPAALPLFASGLAAFGVFARRRKRAKA